MKYFQIFEEYLKEDTEYKYGCVMLYFKFPKMEELHNSIDSSDYEDEDSLEDEPHCTLLYGLHDYKPSLPTAA